ncbi:hypothetical protein ACEZ3G_01895 [Maribacter algicola]|uniref:Uncharacterized protein n=1 Tax=Meishania litoralis TaxID=3434685 RepID=A0ACC7LFI8_9FLAO
MKTTLKNLTLLVLMVLVFKSCTKDDDDNMSIVDASDIPQIQAAIANGDWKITYYFDSDKDETSDYAGYVFTFQEDGVLAVSNGSTALSGAWSITSSDNSNDDSSSNDVDFNIVFSSPVLFEELSDDWEIKKYTSTTIELYDISGGDGTTDFLTFTKN